MKLVFFASFTIFFLGCATLSKDRKVPNEIFPAAFVLGTIHGNMLDQPKNGILDFMKALIAYHPTLIVTETRSNFPGPIDGTIDGGAEQALVHAFAADSNIDIVAADWFSDEHNLRIKKEEAKMSSKVKNELAPLFEKFRKIVQEETFIESQSENTQSLIRARYALLTKYGIKSHDIRNQKICENIRKSAFKYQQKRVIFVFGLAHKYAIEDCLRNININPQALANWYQPELKTSTPISQALKTKAIENLKEAKSVLKNRIRQGYYKTDLENLNDKLSELDVWIEKMEVLKIQE